MAERTRTRPRAARAESQPNAKRRLFDSNVLTVLALVAAIIGSMWVLSADIRALRTELSADVAELRTEVRSDVAEFRTEVRADVAELRADVAELRTEVRADVAELRMKVHEIDARLVRIETLFEGLVAESRPTP